MTKTSTRIGDENSLWGIDMGGTKIEGVILKSAKDPEILYRDRLPTESDKGYDHMLGQTKRLIDKMKAEANEQD